METYPTSDGRPGAPNVQQLMADRRKQAELRTEALKMMTAEGVAAIITPTRDGAQ